MSYSAMQWAFEQTELNTTTKLILIGLAYYRNNKDYRCYPSQSRLTKELGVSVSTINKGLRVLEQRKLISRMRHFHPEHGGSISSSYTFPALDGPNAALRHTPYHRRLTALRARNK